MKWSRSPIRVSLVGSEAEESMKIEHRDRNEMEGLSGELSSLCCDYQATQ